MRSRHYCRAGERAEYEYERRPPRVTVSRSRSVTTAREFRGGLFRGFLIHFSRPNLRVWAQGWDCPSCMESSSSTTEKQRRKISREAGLDSLSNCRSSKFRRTTEPHWNENRQLLWPPRGNAGCWS